MTLTVALILIFFLIDGVLWSITGWKREHLKRSTNDHIGLIPGSGIFYFFFK